MRIQRIGILCHGGYAKVQIQAGIRWTKPVQLKIQCPENCFYIILCLVPCGWLTKVIYYNLTILFSSDSINYKDRTFSAINQQQGRPHKYYGMYDVIQGDSPSTLTPIFSFSNELIKILVFKCINILKVHIFFMRDFCTRSRVSSGDTYILLFFKPYLFC